MNTLKRKLQAWRACALVLLLGYAVMSWSEVVSDVDTRADLFTAIVCTVLVVGMALVALFEARRESRQVQR